MIEVISFNDRGDRHDCAEAETAEQALLAARTLYDEAVERVHRPSIGIYVDGKRAAVFHARPPVGGEGA